MSDFLLRLLAAQRNAAWMRTRTPDLPPPAHHQPPHAPFLPDRQQWGMRAVGAEAAWDLSVGGLAVPAGAAAAAAVRGAAASLEAAPAPAPATARSLAAAHAPAPALAPAHAPAPAPAHPPPSPTPTLTPAPTALPTQTPLEKASLPINATGSAGLVTVCVVDSGGCRWR